MAENGNGLRLRLNGKLKPALAWSAILGAISMVFMAGTYMASTQAERERFREHLIATAPMIDEHKFHMRDTTVHLTPRDRDTLSNLPAWEEVTKNSIAILELRVQRQTEEIERLKDRR